MKRVARSRRPRARQPPRQAAAPGESGTRRRRASSAPPAAAGRRAAPAARHAVQAAAPRGEAAAPAALPSSRRRCRRAKSAYCSGSAGRGDGPAGGEGRVEGRQLAEEHAHRPAVADDVVHGEERHVLLAAEAQQDGPEQRPGGQVERPRRLLARPAARDLGAPRRLAAGPRDRPAAAARPDAGSNGSIRCTGRPSAAAKVVRRASCRRTISATARRRAADVEVAAQPEGARDVVGGGARRRAGRGTRGAPGRRRAAGRRPLGPAERPPGASPPARRRLDRPRRPPPASAARTGRAAAARRRRRRGPRATSRVASSEWPPSVEEVVVDAHPAAGPLRAEHLGPEPGQRLLGRRARRHDARPRPLGPLGAIRARAPAVHLAVGRERQRGRGRRRPPGTMGSGSRPAQPARGAPASTPASARHVGHQPPVARRSPRTSTAASRDRRMRGAAPPRSRPARCGSRGSSPGGRAGRGTRASPSGRQPRQVAGAVEAAPVATSERIGHEALGRQVRPAEVAARQPVAADAQLARDARPAPAAAAGSST